MKEFLIANWGAILAGAIPVIWFIVRQTPTKKDDKVWAFIAKIIDFILADRKKGGGTH